jgi:hypothetical protein
MKIIMQEKRIFFFMLDYLPFIIEINEKMYPSMKIIMQKEEGFSFYINDQQCKVVNIEHQMYQPNLIWFISTP